MTHTALLQFFVDIILLQLHCYMGPRPCMVWIQMIVSHNVVFIVALYYIYINIFTQFFGQRLFNVMRIMNIYVRSKLFKMSLKAMAKLTPTHGEKCGMSFLRTYMILFVYIQFL